MHNIKKINVCKNSEVSPIFFDTVYGQTELSRGEP